ncbi:MAG: restriction endonuclease [Bacteroidales bacterium]|jgi:hypothetical protein|nr:restriction endonuclease [Bacteroidales bacterium]MDD3385544.1 restriction endonuclease [Bacteroidales bacterium]NLO69195.1 ATP-binding protein [Bacteroidales bacterium]
MIKVTKASGETEVFDSQKLERSLRNAGAAEELIQAIVADILDWIFEGVTTKKIYARAFSLLRRKKTVAAMRYKLKQAIMEMGPTGYPFEYLIGRVFEKQGYSVLVGQVIDGHCVTHEMDVIATGKGEQCLVECKYRQDQGNQVSVQTPLYVRSRVDDIIRKRMTMPEYQGLKFSGWVVTNTRFSLDSMQYGKCSGLNLIAWDYPAGNGLKDLIEREKIYPITLLQQLTKKEKQELLDQGIVTCSQLIEKKDILSTLNIPERRLKILINELESICKITI